MNLARKFSERMSSVADRYAAIEIGQAVTVLRPYTGSGTWGHDGYEGRWYVVGKLAPLDLKLARHPADDDYAVICHASRILETTSHTDHPEMKAQ